MTPGVGSSAFALLTVALLLQGCGSDDSLAASRDDMIRKAPLPALNQRRIPWQPNYHWRYEASEADPWNPNGEGGCDSLASTIAATLNHALGNAEGDVEPEQCSP